MRKPRIYMHDGLWRFILWTDLPWNPRTTSRDELALLERARDWCYIQNIKKGAKLAP